MQLVPDVAVADDIAAESRCLRLNERLGSNLHLPATADLTKLKFNIIDLVILTRSLVKLTTRQ